MAGTRKEDWREYAPDWGGKREGAGRPKGTTGAYKGESKRDRNIGIRVTEAEAEMIRSKAAAAGLGVTDFLVRLAEQA